MKKEHSITQLIIDESGSMSGSSDYVIKTYHSIIQAMRNERLEYPQLQQYLEVWSFSDRAIPIRNTVPWNVITDSDQTIPDIDYTPSGGTPLYDALGRSLITLETKLQQQAHIMVDPEVSIIVITDGFENSSVEFDGPHIHRLVTRLQDKNWKFTYYGADHDIHVMAEKIAIRNRAVFSKDRNGFDDLSAKITRERRQSKEDFMRSKGML
jgi:hypothetical protein